MQWHGGRPQVQPTCQQVRATRVRSNVADVAAFSGLWLQWHFLATHRSGCRASLRVPLPVCHAMAQMSDQVDGAKTIVVKNVSLGGAEFGFAVRLWATGHGLYGIKPQSCAALHATGRAAPQLIWGGGMHGRANVVEWQNRSSCGMAAASRCDGLTTCCCWCHAETRRFALSLV